MIHETIILQDGGKNFSGSQKIQVVNFFFNIFILSKIAIGLVEMIKSMMHETRV